MNEFRNRLLAGAADNHPDEVIDAPFVDRTLRRFQSEGLISVDWTNPDRPVVRVLDKKRVKRALRGP